ncbi:hypothetical protein DNTS_008885 [Danionella cerebrum]|uniref:Multidrug and toxin extrusion protein n=1 Tax=Danionella cerebrum TaxID=2873325 RepID=A0A553MVR7_9TELE|nr:hypothetical protein DNTS_008885 [Danionella translucida]
MDKAGTAEACAPLAGSEQITVATVPAAKQSFCSSVLGWLPLAYREELWHVLRLTGPLLISRILNFLLPFVTTIFCGHLGNAELAGYALASATINVTTTATGCGLALACDTLVSQTFGSKNLKRVGEILQRSILILSLFCLPCWAILINAESILLSMKQAPEVARIAQLYVMAFLPAVPAMFLHYLQVSYLQNQGIILPQMFTAAAANVLNLATNYILLHSLKLGVIGSAMANSLSQISICLLLFIYIRVKKLHVKTWDGWSTSALQEWGSYMKLAIPSTLMVCFEWWIYEIGGFLAGMLGEVDLAAQHVLLEIGSIAYMSDISVVFQCVCSGILLGAGKQKIAALSNLICYYCIGLPVGISLMFLAELRILGLWLGLLICVIIQACFFTTLIFKLNWKKATEQAQLTGDSSEVAYVQVSSREQEKSAVESECGEVKALLSVKQLVLRRGLALLSTVLILIAGVTVHLICPLPQAFIHSQSNLTVDFMNFSTPLNPLNLTLI